MLAAVFVLFAAVGYYSDHKVVESVGVLENLSDNLKAAVATEDWFGAAQVLNGIKERWPPVRRNWDLRMHRDEMDDLDLALARLGGFVAERDKSSVLAELGAWKVLLSHVKQKEVLHWRNIL